MNTNENKDGKSMIGQVHKHTVILTDIVAFLPVLAGIILYPQLPDTIVTHWGADGTPNGWSNKIVGVILLPGIMFLLQLAMPFLIKADPKNKNLNPKLADLLCWILPLCSLVCSTATLMGALGMDPKVEVIMPMFFGFLFLLIGNYLPKTTQSYTVGIKLPWTLSSEENWKRTHRLAGFLWALGGILTMVGAFFPWRVAALVIALVVMVVIPVIYSYVLYKKGI